MAVLISCFAACRTAETESSTKAIYGDDNRQDLFEITGNPGLVKAAKATGFLTLSSTLDFVDATHVRLKPAATIESVISYSPMPACPDVRFKKQPVVEGCSGFLVAPDVFVTAGHCIAPPFSCESISIVFGYELANASQDPTVVAKDHVFKCKEVLATKLENTVFVAGRHFERTDFAVLRLDRPVTDQTPLTLRSADGVASAGTELTLIGHPYGMPTKVAPKGKVRKALADLLVTTVDANAGNSGSAALNSSSLAVEGILIAGDTDDDVKGQDPATECGTWRICKEENCVGEFVVPTAVFKEFVP